jgi:hypothetical protein
VQALPLRSPLALYEQQAHDLLASLRAGDGAAVDVFRHRHPRFLSDEIPWLPKPVTDDDIRAVPLDAFDARLAVARWYDFQDWRWLRTWVLAVQDEASPVARFEAAVEAMLHYTAANGVETYRQRTPPNAPAIARLLIARGAEVDALADMYGGRCTTLSMLVSSTPPAVAGMQVALVVGVAARDGAGVRIP